jgi:hypothetical protein
MFFGFLKKYMEKIGIFEKKLFLIFLEISEIFRIFLEFFLELLKKKLISFKKFFEVGIFLDFLLSIQPAIVRWLWVVFYLLF